MAGLVPTIHAFIVECAHQGVEARDKRGLDEMMAVS
jgi:hypothetical protein